MMTRDAIMAELLEIEALLQDDRLNDEDRHALHGAQQALRAHRVFLRHKLASRSSRSILRNSRLDAQRWPVPFVPLQESGRVASAPMEYPSFRTPANPSLSN
jgi:hypothetical protein